MTHVATLIAGAAQPCVDDALVARMAALLPQGRAGQVLDPGVAADVLFTAAPKAAGRAHLRALAQELRSAAGLPVEVVVQADTSNRRKKLLIADMDSTMIGQECIDELADYAGVKAHVAAITERAMRGEIAFEPALRERVALLRGLPVAVVEEVIASRIHLTPGAKTLVATMRAHGAFTALISGGFTLFTGPVSRMIGFHMHEANELIVHEGMFVGEVAEPILGREAKRAALKRLSAEHGLTAEATLAVGDGANDLAMLQAAGLGIAFYAKPQVAVAADACVAHSDLTALLYAQGYARGEFVG